MSESSSFEIFLQKNKDLCRILYSIKEENYKSSIEELKNFDFISNIQNSTFLFQSILFAIGMNSTAIDLYIKLVSDIAEDSSNFKQIISLENCFMIFKTFKKLGFLTAAYPIAYAFYQLFKEKYFDLNQYIEIFLNNLEIPQNKRISIQKTKYDLPFLLWFLPELITSFKTMDKTEFEKICSEKYDFSFTEVISHYLKEFIELYGEIYDIEANFGINSDSLTNIWDIDVSKLINERENINNYNSFYAPIQNDDSDKLKEIIGKEEDFDYKQPFKVSIYEYRLPLIPFTRMDHSFLTLLEAAMFFNSSKCVDYLSQHIQIDNQQNISFSYQIVNGTFDINNISQIEADYYQQFLLLSIQYHRTTILNKLLENIKCELNYNLLHWYCICSNNTDACNILQDNNIIPAFNFQFKGKLFKYFLSGISSDKETTSRTLVQQMLFMLFSDQVKTQIDKQEEKRRRKKEAFNQILLGIIIILIIALINYVSNKIADIFSNHERNNYEDDYYQSELFKQFANNAQGYGYDDDAEIDYGEEANDAFEL